MPFYIYDVERGASEQLTFNQKRNVSLAGKHGPYRSYVEKLMETDDSEHIPWEMTEADLLQELGYSSPDRYAFVIDLKPSAQNNVSLYRLLRTWGYSSPNWTPIAIQLDPLFVDHNADQPDRFKEEFTLPAGERPLVHEFLYLRGGTRTDGGWGWGRVGNVNGALLWPDTFNYFAEQIRPYTT